MLFKRRRAAQRAADDVPGPPGPGPEEVGFLSRFAYWWLNPLIMRGYRRQLVPEDLWEIPDRDRADVLERFFYTNFAAGLSRDGAKPGEEEEQLPQKRRWLPRFGRCGTSKEERPKASINRVLIKQHLSKFVFSMLLMLGSQIYNLVSPTFIQQLTRFTADPSMSRGVGYVFVFLLAVGQWVGIGVCQSHSFLLMYEIGISARAALGSYVYRKSLRLSNSARQNLTVGEIVNLMSNDTQRYVEVSQYLQSIWSGPFVIVVGLALLIHLIGVAALAGLALMVLSLPLQAKMFMWSATLRQDVMQHSDRRIKQMNEVLQGVKVIKLYSWEDSFADNVHAIRKREMRGILRINLLRAVNFGLFSSLPSLIAVISLIVYAAKGNPLSADIVFPAISYLNVLRFPMLLLPMLVTQLAQLKISTKRLTALFSASEISESDRTWEQSDGVRNHVPDGGAPPSGGEVTITDGHFVWTDDRREAAKLEVLTNAKKAGGGAAAGKKGNLVSRGTARALAMLSRRRRQQRRGELEGGASSDKMARDDGDAAAEADVRAAQPVVVEAAAAAQAPAAAVAGDVAAPPPMLQGDAGVGGSPKEGSSITEESDEKLKQDSSSSGAGGAAGLKSKPTPETESSSGGGRGGERGEAMEHEIFALRDIQFHVRPGEFVTVVGAVGSGKSSLVSALLGEMTRRAGGVEIRGSVAYVAQTAWIFNDTLRNNILFNRPFDAARYERSIACTSLQSDIDILPGGDATEIGEKGINLSGGQKQRVSLARAVYADADIYVLDDPLSAVDAHVGEHIFRECLRRQLRHKTRILVTNQMHLLPQVDRIYVFRDGRIAESGSFQNLRHDGSVLSNFMRVYGAQLQSSAGGGGGGGGGGAQKSVASGGAPYDRSEHSVADDSVADGKMAAGGGEGQADGGGGVRSALIVSEDRVSGTVNWRVYISYLRAGGGLAMAAFILLAYTLAQVALLAPDIWLTNWTNHYTIAPQDTTRRYGYYAGIYCLLGVLFGLLAVVRSMLFALLAASASRQLHQRMFLSVIRAPMSFFDTTPLGRVLNRFAKDTDAADVLLPPLMDTQIYMTLMIVGVFLLIAVYLPWFLIPLAPIVALYWLTQRFYRRSSRELQRIENVQRSPIYAHFSESLTGVSTLRAYNRVEESLRSNYAKQDRANMAYFLLQIAMRWLQFRLEILAFLVLAVVGIMVVESRGSSLISLNSSEAGLLLTYSLTVTTMLSFVVRNLVDMETKMTSVERVLEYGENIAPEAARVVDDRRPPDSWPSHGHVQVEQLQMRYRDGLELVLKDASFDVPPLFKVGIAGRTGSGKSSLAVALFRLVEPCGGRIVIDGVDIASIGLHDLRSRLGMIPQDPVIFSGTVRFNLDPTQQHEDEQLWEALQHVELRRVVKELPGGLDAVVAEGGENFSLGQRQLFCIARALLRAPRVLVMDEATANVDVETDALIQATIRREFRQCTVLTIAHRINTIIDSDRVLVMHDGEVAEYDAPGTLMARPNSLFSGLLGAQGRAQRQAQQQRDAGAGAPPPPPHTSTQPPPP